MPFCSRSARRQLLLDQEVHEWLDSVQVRKLVAFLEKARLVKAGLTAQGVLEEISRLAFTDIRASLTSGGT